MSARILKFVPHDEYERVLFEEFNAGVTTNPEEHVTALEQMKALHEHSMQALWHLTVFFKKTGKWNETTDNLMRRMVTLNTRICGELSGVRKYGEAAIESREGGDENRDSNGSVSPVGTGA